LDFVKSEDRYIHNISLDDEIDIRDEYDYFRYEENYEENEAIWLEIKNEVFFGSG
jgi:hypothetical protein